MFTRFGTIPRRSKFKSLGDPRQQLCMLMRDDKLRRCDILITSLWYTFLILKTNVTARCIEPLHDRSESSSGTYRRPSASCLSLENQRTPDWQGTMGTTSVLSTGLYMCIDMYYCTLESWWTCTGICVLNCVHTWRATHFDRRTLRLWKLPVGIEID